MSYQRCSHWMDYNSCNTTIPIPNQPQSSCDEIIEGHRNGFCLCHDRQMEVALECDHQPITCNQLCRTTTMGCKDVNQLAVAFNSDVKGCNGDWSEPGIYAAQNALCDIGNGYGICTRYRLKALGLSEYQCGHYPDPNTFYLTKSGTLHRIFGCGNLNEFDQLPVGKNTPDSKWSPLVMSLREKKIKNQSYLQRDGPWKLKSLNDDDQDGHHSTSTGRQFRSRVYKTDPTGGGIMCCIQNPKMIRNIPDGRLNVIETPMFLQVLVCILFGFIIIWFWFQITRIIIEIAARYIPCVRRVRDWDGILKVGKWTLPLTWNGRRKVQQIRDINALECRHFREYQDVLNQDQHDLISDDSGACIICWERYEAESKVVRLNCGHHYHKECASVWLLEHKECPVCRQDFTSAENQYNNSGHRRRMEDIEMQEVPLQSEQRGSNQSILSSIYNGEVTAEESTSASA